MDSKLDNVVSEHAVTLGILVNTVQEIKIFMKESVESQKRQEVIMEKLANFEANTKSSIDRLHRRCDDAESQIKDIEKIMEEKETFVLAKVSRIEPSANKADSLHSGLMFVVKALGGIVITMVVGMFIWLIKAGAVKWRNGTNQKLYGLI